MPFADMQIMIAGPLQFFSQGNFAARHAFRFIGHVMIGMRIVIMHLMKLKCARRRVGFGKLLQNRPKGIRGRGEFKTEAGRIAPGHQHGARRRTDGTAGIAIGEPHAFFTQAVNMRRLNQAAAIQADIVKPHIIGQNDNNIGRAFAVFIPTAALPANGAMRGDRIIHFLNKADGFHNQRGPIGISHSQKKQDNQPNRYGHTLGLA